MADGIVPRASRAFTVEDLLDFRVLADIDISPDGRSVVYVAEDIDPEKDTTFTTLYLVPSAGGEARQLTFERCANSSPRFSPSGDRIAFLSSRGGSQQQLYVLAVAGGEAKLVTSMKGGAGTPAWSPDGTRIAFAAALPPDAPPHAPRVIRRGSYKLDGSGFIANAPMQLFVVDANGGEARQLLSGDGSAMEPCWSPDGERIAFSRMRAGKTDAHRGDIWIIDANGGEPRQLTKDCAHSMAPVFSPDGSQIAFLGSRRAGDARRQPWIVSTNGGDERLVTSEDEEIASFPLARTAPPMFTPDGKSLLVVDAHDGRSRVSKVDVATGKAAPLIEGDRQVTLAVRGGSHIAFIWSATHVCGKLGIVDSDGANERLLVDLNEAWAAGRSWPRVELREVGGDVKTSALVFVPHGKGPFPLLVDVHGGPASYVELGFPYHPYWYELASKGWAILSINPSGSASKGKEFSDRLRARWGELDLPEHLAAIDALVAEGIADGRRVAIAGKSYGGYMAAWAIGKSKRFRAAVVSAGVINLESHFGTSDSGYYVDPFDMKAEPFEDRDLYRALSPVQHAHEATTPTLILQGEDDQRCPVGQAEELFATLLRANKTDVELVIYPGGAHSLAEKGRPSHRVDYHRRFVEWVERHAGAQSATCDAK